MTSTDYYARAQAHAPKTKEEMQAAAQRLAAQGFSAHTLAAIFKIDCHRDSQNARGSQGDRVSAAPRDIIRRVDGVVLRYSDPAVLRGYHAESKRQHGDRLRCSILKSEVEIRYLRIMLECLQDELSAAALEHFEFALRTIENTLAAIHHELGSRVDDTGGDRV